MPLPDHLTYEPTDHEYPWNYERHFNPDAPKIYYTHAHIAHMKALEGKASPANTDAIAKVRDRHNRDRRVAAKRTEKGTKASAAKRRAAKEAA